MKDRVKDVMFCASQEQQNSREFLVDTIIDVLEGHGEIKNLIQAKKICREVRPMLDSAK
jgi:hypothetical protein